MKNEIKVGEFIRTNRGHIGKIKRIELDKIDKSLKWYVFDHKEFEINIIKEEYINKPYIVKHSPNLIDIFKKGDFIYTDYGWGWYFDKFSENIITMKNDRNDFINVNKNEIHKILTKEMMESISYKVTKM